MRLDSAWTPHTVTVQPYAGEGGNGPVYGTPASLPNVYVRDLHELLTDAHGEVITSTSRVYCSLEDTPTLQSLVTIWAGTSFERTSPVVKISRADHPDWPGLGVAYLR